LIPVAYPSQIVGQVGIGRVLDKDCREALWRRQLDRATRDLVARIALAK
jgi:hypothetical protein